MDQARPDWDARLRSAGLRSTAQRRAVLQALFEARHATVDQLAAEVQQTLPDVSLSTIYRTLETLDEAGLVTHAHLHHGSPTYHSVDEEPHVHLVCTGCGGIGQQPISVAASMAAQLQESTGFIVDVSHLAVHGLCATCAGVDGEQQPVEDDAPFGEALEAAQPHGDQRVGDQPDRDQPVVEAQPGRPGAPAALTRP